MITVFKAKQEKGGLLDVHFFEQGTDNLKVPTSRMCPWPVHQDLTDAWTALSIHWLILTGYAAASAVTDISDVPAELIEGVHVKGFSFGGEDKAEGIILSGHRILKNKKAVIVNTPFTRFEEKDDSRYQWMDDLINCLDTLRSEVVAYMNGTKRGENPQQELPFSEPVTKAKIAEEDKGGVFKKEVLNGASETWVDSGKDIPSERTVASKVAAADPDAMKRVAAMGTDQEDAVAHQTNTNPTVKEKKERKKKKVAQTAAAPGGEIEVEE